MARGARHAPPVLPACTDLASVRASICSLSAALPACGAGFGKLIVIAREPATTMTATERTKGGKDMLHLSMKV